MPNRMSIIFYIINEQCWNWKPSKTLNISANRPVHHKELCNTWILKNCVENGCSTLRMAKHCEIWSIVEPLQNLLEKTKGESLDSLFAAWRTTISRAVNGNDIIFFKIGHSHQVFMQKICIFICWILWAWSMHD